MKPLLFCFCSISLFVAAARAEPPASPGRSAPDALSLQAVTESVLAGNPAVLEAHAKWEAMKQRVPQAAAWEDLKITGGTRAARFANISRNGFTDQMLGVEQMIPLSGRNHSRERIAAAEAVAALEEARRTELDVIAKARTAYFTLAKTQALLALSGSDEAFLKQLLEASRARFQAGGQSQAEVLSAQNELARLTENRRELQREESEADTQLNVLMNRDPFLTVGAPVVFAGRGEPARLSVEHLRATILSHRPEILLAEAGLAQAQAELEFAHRAWIPDPALSVQAQRYNDAAQAVSEVDVGVSVNLPWLNRKKYRAAENEAGSEVEAAQKQLAGARIEALGLLRNQLEKIGTLAHHIHVFDQQLIPNADQAWQSARASYENGRSTLGELMEAQRAVWNLEATARGHLAEYQMALAELDALVGGDLHLFSPAGETTVLERK